VQLEAGARVAARYRLVRLLASGGMGQVWVARSEATGAEVALKVLHRSDNPTKDARFRNEARFGAGLSHRNVVRVFDLLEEDDGTLVLVMELLRGEPLADLLARRGPLSTPEALAVLLPLLSGLGHAHASGVVHRDVTPANVFLSVEPDGEVIPKLVDFGIAKEPVAASVTLEGAVLGTPRYMAPEQIRAASDIDGRADLFSVAVIAYELVTGVSPFAAPTPAASLAAVLEAPVDPDPRIEPRVWVELQRALAKRPYQRHKDAAEMAEALRAAIGANDATLAALLRRDPPVRGEPWGQAAARAGAAATADGQSLDAVQRATARRWGVLGAVGVAAAVVGAIAVFRPPRPSLPAAQAPTPADSGEAVVVPVPVPSPAPVATQTEETAASTAAPPPASTASPQPARPAVHHASRPRPVATTPGF
jgi:serine/threonine-protein kinase